MKQLIIGLDIDGVIIDYIRSILPLLSEICKQQINYEDITHPSLTQLLNVLDIDERTAETIWNQVLKTDFLLKSPPVEGAIEGLGLLTHHDIRLITGRPESIKGITLSWLDINGIKYDRIVFESYKAAGLSSPEKECDLFIEDQLEIARVFAEAGINTLLLDQPWNLATSLPENCHRVYNWSEIIETVSQLEQEN